MPESAEYYRTYRKRNLEKVRAKDRGYYRRHKETVTAFNRAQNAKIKAEVVAHYSNGTMKCAKCGFSDIRALSIDHINGGGTKHLKQIGESNITRWLRRNNYPSGFQVLCMNCQFIKRWENRENRR